MSIVGSEDNTRPWRKASHSVGNGECVEVSSAPGRVSVRDSTNPDGPVLCYSSDAFRSFLETAKRPIA
jgi:uncharacterized protein DUF397